MLLLFDESLSLESNVHILKVPKNSKNQPENLHPSKKQGQKHQKSFWSHNLSKYGVSNIPIGGGQLGLVPEQNTQEPPRDPVRNGPPQEVSKSEVFIICFLVIQFFLLVLCELVQLFPRSRPVPPGNVVNIAGGIYSEDDDIGGTHKDEEEEPLDVPPDPYVLRIEHGWQDEAEQHHGQIDDVDPGQRLSEVGDWLALLLEHIVGGHLDEIHVDRDEHDPAELVLVVPRSEEHIAVDQLAVLQGAVWVESGDVLHYDADVEDPVEQA